MPKQPATVELAKERALAVAGQMGYTLIDVELAKESTGRFLRFFIEKDAGITLDDCERFHRALQPQVEQIDYDYMEVSSPGADRPLKRPEDFALHEGAQVEVRLYAPMEKRKVFQGALVGLREGCVVIRDAQGEEIAFETRRVALVKPIVEMDEDAFSALNEEEDV